METKVKQYASHKDVDLKYKWDLNFLLKGKTTEQCLNEILDILEQFVKLVPNKYDNADNFLEYLKLEDIYKVKMNHLGNYVSNALAIDATNQEVLTLREKMNFKLIEMEQKIGPEESEFFANATKIKKWIEDKKFDDYRFRINHKIEEKKHILSKSDEVFRQKEARADISAHEIFNILSNVEIDYGHAVTSKSKKIVITLANYNKLVKHDDASVRKTAQLSFRNAFLKNKSTYSSLIYQHKRSEATWSKILKFDSTIDSLIFGDRVPKELLTTLYQAVQKNVPMVKLFRDKYKQFYKIKFQEVPTKWDMARELVKQKIEVKIEDAKNDVLESIKPFGQEYTKIIKQAYEENWIDFMPIKNKHSGAYSIGGAYGVSKKLILMNWDNTDRSTETLAHELGHSLHSYFSEKSQTIRNASYPIFLAEIASIFNELMLFDYWTKNSKNELFKFQVMYHQIVGFIGTVFRQVEWSNFEFDFYEALDRGDSLASYESLAKLYYQNSLRYSINPKTKKYKPEEQYPSFYVPHFYYGFYVYKYAIGQLVANIFFQKYKQEGPKALDAYVKKFLSAGGSAKPLDILKSAGVDLLDKNIYDLGFAYFENIVKEWIKLGDKIFKTKKVVKKSKN